MMVIAGDSGKKREGLMDQGANGGTSLTTTWC
jgi:hypothetical protein